MSFKILTNRLPAKWQKDLRETLGDAAAPAPAATPEAQPGQVPAEIVINAESAQIVEDLQKWIQRMNRQEKSSKQGKQSFPNQGISLTLERSDGTRITLTERNVGMVKQFLSS
ncbi:MAG: hypothetical protein ACREOI_23950 [bacterium]